MTTHATVHATVSDAHQDVADKHTVVSDVHRDTSDAKAIVPDVRRGISNANPIVSGVRTDVVDTRTVVSNIHRNNLERRGGADGRNQAVSTTRTLPVTEQLTLTITQSHARLEILATVNPLFNVCI